MMTSFYCGISRFRKLRLRDFDDGDVVDVDVECSWQRRRPYYATGLANLGSAPPRVGEIPRAGGRVIKN
jgi:hypothetical protein